MHERHEHDEMSYHVYHITQIKAFDLYMQAVRDKFAHTKGVDPGPWHFWFEAERGLP